MFKILDIGSGKESVAAIVFADVEDKEITRLDIDPAVKPDILHDITKPLPTKLNGTFDIVYLSHVVEHVDRRKIMDVLHNSVDVLKEMGELWVLVPSLEFVGGELVKNGNTPALQQMLYGGQRDEYDYHKAGFTLLDLRNMMELCGLIIRTAHQAPFEIVVEDLHFDCLQNVCVAAKYESRFDSGSAID